MTKENEKQGPTDRQIIVHKTEEKQKTGQHEPLQ